MSLKGVPATMQRSSTAVTALRVERGLTLRALCAEFGYVPNCTGKMSGWTTGHTPAPEILQHRLAEYFGTLRVDLFDGEGYAR